MIECRAHPKSGVPCRSIRFRALGIHRWLRQTKTGHFRILRVVSVALCFEFLPMVSHSQILDLNFPIEKEFKKSVSDVASFRNTWSPGPTKIVTSDFQNILGSHSPNDFKLFLEKTCEIKKSVDENIKLQMCFITGLKLKNLDSRFWFNDFLAFDFMYSNDWREITSVTIVVGYRGF